MDVKELKSLIECIANDGSIQLLEPLSTGSGFFSADGKLVYMAVDSFDYGVESISTEYLDLHMHVSIHAIDKCPTFSDGYYNIITYKGNFEDENIESFVKLCVMHATHENELPFRDFFYALISLFQLPREELYKNAIGIYGELKYMQHVAEEYSIDLSEYWHRRGSISQFDFSNKEIGIEIKTTTSDEMALKIKHDQIFGDFTCFLVAVECEQSDIGESISDVLHRMKSKDLMFKSLNFAINLEKELKRVNPQQISDLLFHVTNIRVFNADRINPFGSLPDNVSYLRYELDLSDSAGLSIPQEREMLSKFIEIDS